MVYRAGRSATATARALGFPKVPAEKLAVAEAISAYVAAGRVLVRDVFGHGELDLALSAPGADIVAAYADQTPMDPRAYPPRWTGAVRSPSKTPGSS